MSESDLAGNTAPANDTALSLDEAAAAIEGLLSDAPATDPVQQKTESQPKGQDKPAQEPKAEEQPEGEELGDDDLDLEDEGTTQQEGGPDEPAFKAGQFASDDAKVTLQDGRVITVSELKRNNLFQKDYSQKTEALAKERETFHQERQTFEAQRAQHTEAINQIEHQRNVILVLAQKLLPQEPAPVDPNSDPLGYINYMSELQNYNKTMGELQTLWNANQQQMQAAELKYKQETEQYQKQAKEQIDNLLKAERDKLTAAVPQFKEEAAWKAFEQDAYKYGEKYWGLDPETMNSVPDHRFVLLLKDAMAYRKALEKRATATAAPAAQQQAPSPRIPPRQRMTQTPETRAQVESLDRLRKSGSFQDAAKALEKFV